MKRRFSRIRREKEEFELDITSLLDILVILLVFLLKSYNPSDLKLDVADALELPASQTRSLGSTNVLVQINKDYDVIIDNETLGKISQTDPEEIPFLAQKLGELKSIEDKKIDQIVSNDPESVTAKEALKNKESKKINFVLHKELPYGIMRKVMHTATVAGFPKFKFIVKGNY